MIVTPAPSSDTVLTAYAILMTYGVVLIWLEGYLDKRKKAKKG